MQQKGEIQNRDVRPRSKDSRLYPIENLESYDELLTVAKKNITKIQELSRANNPDIIRSQIVLISSLIDYYFCEMIQRCMIRITKDENVQQLDGRWKNLKIEFKYVQEAIAKPESKKWLKKFLKNQYNSKTIQSPEQIKQALSIIENQFFDNLNNKNDKEELLERWYKRRNQIAHSFDIKENSLSDRRSVNKQWVQNNIPKIKNFIIEIHEIILEKLEVDN